MNPTGMDAWFMMWWLEQLEGSVSDGITVMAVRAINRKMNRSNFSHLPTSLETTLRALADKISKPAETVSPFAM